MARKKIDVEQIGWDEQIAENVSINGNLTLTGSFTQQGNQLKITSAGPTSLFLEADTNNGIDEETDTAFIKLSQDGGVVTSYFGLNPANDKDPENNDYTDAVSNALIITNNYSNGVIQFGTSNSTKLTIDAAGDLGIGTNAPRCPLHIARSLSGETFSNANLSGMLIETNGSSNAYFALQVATVGGGKCFSVTNAGRVGIGTSTPNTELDVVGDLVVSGSQLKVTSTGPTSLYLQADTDNVTETDTAFIKMTQDGQYLTSYLGYTPNDSEDPEGGSLTDGLANTLLLSCHNSFPGGPPASSRIQFATEQAVRMTIEDDGKVGIGTTTPSTELDVSGDVTVSGQITTATQPAFLVRKPSNNQDLIALGGVDVTLSTEDFDVGSNFASNTFTAPTTGVYIFTANVYLTDLDTDATYYALDLVTDVGTYRLAIVDPSGFSADVGEYTLNGSMPLLLTAGDTAKIQVDQSGGTQKTSIRGSGTRGTFFAGYLLG